MPPATYRGNPSTGNLRTLQRGGLPPSLAPLVRNPFTQPRHYHPFIFYIVGRGLDPSATFRPTPANGSPVGEKFIPPAHLPPPLTSAGRRGRRPLQRQPAWLLLTVNGPGGLGSGRPTSITNTHHTKQKAGANISFAPAVLLLRSHSLITLFVIFRTVSASSWESSYLYANFDCPFKTLTNCSLDLPSGSLFAQKHLWNGVMFVIKIVLGVVGLMPRTKAS